MPYPFRRVKRSAAATERSPERDPRVALRWIRSGEEVIANPRRSAQGPAWNCMLRSGLNLGRW